jgi:predicted protein tyrosine phosphatase
MKPRPPILIVALAATAFIAVAVHGLIEYRAGRVILDQFAETQQDSDTIVALDQVLDDAANRPALVHCWQGVKRTGMMVAIYKMEYLRMDNERAIAELPAFGRELEDFAEADREMLRRYVPRWRRPPGASEPAAAPVSGAATVR